MYDTSGDRIVLGPNAQNLLRIIIASYFIAGAIGVIPGCDLTPLFGQVLPEGAADIAASVTVFVLAYLVMIGIRLRAAALLLGILTFWASYIRLMEVGIEAGLGTFWRDLALIASLMLTYAIPDQDAIRRHSLLRGIRPRRIRPHRLPARQEVNPMSGYEPFQASYGHEKLSVEEMERVFSEDFRNARAPE
ncbi:MAG: hypothetical protein ACK5JR_18360 [Tropicimonas sp.]|uniref:hypothetical protein n=1 Tax=Tropicimonas sp. TaxID=2067044 RepID=UPI003A865D10